MNYTKYCNQTKRLLLTEKKRKKTKTRTKTKKKNKKNPQNKQTNKKEKTHQNYGIKWNNKFYKYGDSANVCG